MKIQVLKSGNTKTKPYNVCPMFIDVPPDGVDVRKPETK